ncbi:DUF1798 family protein [Terrilactibacillus sp. BCM23-1]|uniref:DUF1798 family protein n=1 Tax=Terrilactibacillus tamarindi TaxID=2599694 RepID=A0A6N8CSE2_9BACI|nr:YppE family protein [Terrilactibacillus tamarindi]MTT32610.1 DUF1798 family protein [Terrilactibacillus tamarindi]
MDSNKFQTLKLLTEKLRLKNKALHDIFIERTTHPEEEIDFFGMVKPFADELKEILEEFEPLVMTWVRECHPKYVYPLQVENLVENLSIVSVTAFQKDTRRKRFLNTIHAIDYALDTILEQLMGQEQKPD